MFSAAVTPFQQIEAVAAGRPFQTGCRGLEDVENLAIPGFFLHGVDLVIFD